MTCYIGTPIRLNHTLIYQILVYALTALTIYHYIIATEVINTQKNIYCDC